MNKEELLKKIKALAESGIGGEKENAKRILKDLMLKFNIKEDELEEEYIKEFDIKMPKFFNAVNLAAQIIYSIVGKEVDSGKGLYIFKKKRKYSIKATTSEFLEFEAKFKFYFYYFKKEINRFYDAFIQRNEIFPPAEKSREVTCREPTEEDYKMLALASKLEKHNYLKQIEGWKNESFKNKK